MLPPPQLKAYSRIGPSVTAQGHLFLKPPAHPSLLLWSWLAGMDGAVSAHPGHPGLAQGMRGGGCRADFPFSCITCRYQRLQPSALVSGSPGGAGGPGELGQCGPP